MSMYKHRSFACLTEHDPIEIVLSTLVAAFRFEHCPRKPFVWNSAGVAYPAAKTGNKDPEMFLQVSLAAMNE